MNVNEKTIINNDTLNKFILFLFEKNLFNKKEIIIIDDSGIKKTEALHGNVNAKVLFSVKNCNVESNIELIPKIVNGTKIFLFL